MTLYKGQGEDEEDEEDEDYEDEDDEYYEDEDDEEEMEENRNCFYCEQNSHLQYDCELYNEERDLLWCTACNHKGHDDESCF